MGCSNKCGKTCHDKSCQRFYNNNAQTLAAGATLQLQIAGTKVVDSGISIETEPNNFTTVKTGLYHIAGDVSITPTAGGTVTFQVYMDGVALPCTLRTITLPATGSREIHTETDLCLSGCCCDVSHTFTFQLTSVDTAAGSVIQSCFGILKLA